MDLIPCEILHIVADNLLPRYRCRLALTSCYYYDCLYSPLLRWHAKWALIPVPKYCYKTIGKKGRKGLSVMQCSGNKKVVIYENTYNIGAYNLTTLLATIIHLSTIDGKIHSFIETYRINIYGLDDFFSTDILSTRCKYAHKNVLIYYWQSKHPLLSLDPKILRRILMNLEFKKYKKKLVKSNSYTRSMRYYI